MLDQREQQVAHLFFELLGGGGCPGGLKLSDFFVKLLDDVVDPRPIKARAGRFPADLAGFEHRRLRARDAVEYRFLRLFRGGVGTAFVALFLLLDLLPAVQHLSRSFSRLIAEDVRMPA